MNNCITFGDKCYDVCTSHSTYKCACINNIGDTFICPDNTVCDFNGLGYPCITPRSGL